MSPGAPHREAGAHVHGGRGVARTAVLVPVKAFHQAKRRLAPALDRPARAELARAMATRVVAAAGGLPVAVVCDDGAVAEWAAGCGAQVLWRPGRGLNVAVTDGLAALAAHGVTTAIVAHADLPHAVDLAWLAPGASRPPLPAPGPGAGPPPPAHVEVVVVPDRRGNGTNVIVVPTAAGFTFSYGPGSFARHRAEAARLGLAVRIVREPRLGWDVDIPDDLATPDWAPAR